MIWVKIERLLILELCGCYMIWVTCPGIQVPSAQAAVSGLVMKGLGLVLHLETLELSTAAGSASQSLSENKFLGSAAASGRREPMERGLGYQLHVQLVETGEPSSLASLANY